MYNSVEKKCDYVHGKWSGRGGECIVLIEKYECGIRSVSVCMECGVRIYRV